MLLLILDTASTIVKRDASGNFSASTITANLIGNVTGSSSLNVLKAGDSMTGGLNMLNQQPVIFQDSTAGNYVGINAPTDVISSYTISLPATAPTASQLLQASSTTPSNLKWVNTSGSINPADSGIIYVTKYGNDTTGNGSFDAPYASLAKAIETANTIATLSNPVAIYISPGTYIEDNSSGPLAITANGISIVGDSSISVILVPNTPTNNFLSINNPIQMVNVTLESSSPLATGISISAANLSIFENVYVYNFLIGINCTGDVTSAYGFNNCLFTTNGTGLNISNAHAECNSCTFFGSSSRWPAQILALL